MLKTLLYTLPLTLAINAAAFAQDANQPAAAATAASTPAAAQPAKQAKSAVIKQTAKAAPAPAVAAPAPAAAPVPATSSVPETTGDSEKKPVSTEAFEPRGIVWPFSGMMGHVDRQAAQRGFQVYKQVCSACHSMNLVSYRSLGALGFSEAEIAAVAAEKQVPDFDDKGNAIQHPAKASDHFVPPYPNEDASRAANNGAYPPDLSLIVKARDHGPNYVYSLLTGFGTAPANETPVANKYYNPYFSGHWISMPPPLSDNIVTYQDGTPATVDQMARDVVTFLQWAAEPEMEQRHEMGIRVLAFLVVMAGFFYVAKKRIWRKIGH